MHKFLTAEHILLNLPQADMNLIETLKPDQRAINSIAKGYSALSYYVQLSAMLKKVYPSTSFANFSKMELHLALNYALVKHYRGEEILKYQLTKRYINDSKFIGAYEINVNSSRVDFLVINGHTTSFEIKSSLDNLSKLRKQAKDYASVFDYNCLVADEIHFEKAKTMVPDEWGLWCYVDGTYEIFRKPLRNSHINPEAQLEQLSKTERKVAFGEANIDVSQIRMKFSDQQINSLFRKALKDRYRERWNFLSAYHKQILPVDYQFFFNNNIQPKNIYNL
ncbi:MAG: sce7726 family protein [Bacteroidetes bacterium]|nr:sce7726 family protein [Bacteroidota bacterium]